MSSPISSVRDQNKLIAAFDKLVSSDRVHKNDLKTLNKIVDKLIKVENGQDIMSKMGANGKDPNALKNTFSMLLSKLEKQNSGMFKEKETALTNIRDKMMPVVEKVKATEINNQLSQLADTNKFIDNKIAIAASHIKTFEDQNAHIHNEIGTLKTDIEFLRLSGIDVNDHLAKIDEMNMSWAQAKVSRLDAVRQKKIETIDNEIDGFKNARQNLIDFANREKLPGVSGVEADLVLAEKGEIYDKRDTGFGPTKWRSHISSDAYAMEKFGYIEKEGRREYSDKIKEPNQNGRKWQTLVKNLNKASEEINALKVQAKEINKQHQSQAHTIMNTAKQTQKESIDKNSHSKYEEIKDLENDKKYNLKYMKNLGNELSHLEGRKKSLETQKLTLEHQLNPRLDSDA
jgi:hypothetical protein